MTSPSLDTAELPARPDLTITVGDRTIKMVYGLEMDIRRLLPDPITALQLVRYDPFTQDYLVRRVLTDKRQMIVKVEDLISIEEVDLTSDDVEAILSWVTEHALYFFVKRTLEMTRLGVRYNQALPTPSTAGSEGSPSTTPFAGPSES